MAINFPSLPPEMWIRIAQHGDATVCSTLSQVSTLFDAIVQSPVLAKTWKREVYTAIDTGPRFGLLLDFLLEDKSSWRELFLAQAVVQRFFTIKEAYNKNDSFHTCTLRFAKNTIDPLILLEGHLALDVEEEIEEQIEAMREPQRRTQHPETYEAVFSNLKTLDAQQPGDSEVCYYLSECYFRGIGVEVTPEKAFAYALVAAKKGCEPACCNLGAFFAKGFGVQQNYNEAITWLHPLTSPQARFFLGIIRKTVAIPDFHAAFHLIEEAAKGGHAEAQCLAGGYYLTGYGTYEEENHPVVTVIDPQKSFKFFESSARQGYIDAIYPLGDCYLQGLGTQKSFTKGFACFKLASRYGDRYCSTETFLSIESREDRCKMWQFLKEEAQRGGINADMAIWSISRELGESEVRSFSL